MTNRKNVDPLCVILAGGRGRRMASSDRHKVCFKVGGVPAIVRAMRAYRAAGIRRFLVVVGQMADQVMACVADEFPDAAFAYQSEPRGTGHAAAVAARVLSAMGWDGPVMITMGDKVTWPEVVSRFLEQFRRTPADALVSALPKTPETTAGRLVCEPDGRILGIVEHPDLCEAMAAGRKIVVRGRRLDPAPIEQEAQYVNASLYLFRFDPLRRALKTLRTDNVQGELYLTDVVGAIAETGHAALFPIDDPEDLMAFNTPAELLRIEEVVQRREAPARVVRRRPTARDALLPVGAWLQRIAHPDAQFRAFLHETYGGDPDLVRERLVAMERLLKRAAEVLGPEREVILCRAPGRINLMGRHVDHRGGYVNVMAISREVLLAAAPREDDRVTLENLDAQRFGPRSFRIRSLLEEASWSDWLDFVDSEVVRRLLQEAPGDWSHYARAPLLRLQHAAPDKMLRGMDCVVSGNIPMGAGLSSSSALVVAFGEAAVVLNELDFGIRDYVDLLGEGEWFVGSRGGSADHAAIRTSRPGSVSRIGFFPFRIEEEVPLPSDVCTIVAYSGKTAEKSAGARDVFNQRVACYELAQMLLRRTWPPAAGIERLRDLTPERVRLAPAEIYRALKLLPLRAGRRRLRALLSDESERVDRVLGSHRWSGPYDLRGVSLFGIGECARSERFAALLKKGDMEAVGRFMSVSHDGDRCFRFDAGGRPRAFRVRLDDAALDRLAAENLDPALHPGRYRCSTEAIDRIVDLARFVPGVIGAQLAGAGLGGCAMVLAKREAAGRVCQVLEDQFYRPRGLEPAAWVCVPVGGACVITPGERAK